MERAAALKKLTKMFGKKLGYRINAKAPSREEREVARAECLVACKTRDDLLKRMKARADALMDSDAEYQALKAECKIAQEDADRLGAISRRVKIEVMTNEGLFWHHRADGDSWEEIFEKLAKRAA